MKKNKAFSLLEISVVIIILGILISGIYSAIDLYQDYKISIAKNLTQNSRVTRIEDLVLWLEASQKSSFEPANIQNGQKIVKWKNIAPNILPQDRALNDASSSGAPIFTESAVNFLPSLDFSVTQSNCLYVRSGFDGLGKALTLYLLIRTKSDWIYNDSSIRLLERPGDNSKYAMWSLRSNQLVFTNSSNVYNYFGAYTSFKPSYSLLYELIINRGDGIYLNVFGDTKISAYKIDSYNGAHINNPLSIGCSGDVNAYYSEIIAFDRALNTSERNDVVNYLIKKWGLKK